MKKAKVESLTVSISKGSQDVRFEELVKVGGEKLLLQIRSDSYQVQCWAVVKIWDPAKRCWNDLASVHYGQMRTQKGLSYQPRPVVANDFTVDRAELLRKALLVIL